MPTESPHPFYLTFIACLLLAILSPQASLLLPAPMFTIHDRHIDIIESMSQQTGAFTPKASSAALLPGRSDDQSVAESVIDTAENALAASSDLEAVTTNWTPAYPTARSWHAMAYDSSREVVVLFGGYYSYGGFLDDTWEWDGTKWQKRNPLNHPSARQGHAMAYDAARGVVVLFGGDDGSPRDDTWEWDGTDWIECNPSNDPGMRYLHAMAYDTVHEVVVLFGGANVAGDLDDTWEWNGTEWIPQNPAAQPTARSGHGMAYDSARGVAVLFGGNDNSGARDDTWEWDGTNWMERSPADHPTPRAYHAMAYDSVRQVVVLFSGSSASYGWCWDETWEWDGMNWTLRDFDRPGRRGAALAYDSTRAVTVLFGGRDSNASYLNDTWEWDGTNWVAPPGPPSPRYGHAMAYDSLQGVAVLFGGLSTTGLLNDTWEWNGTDWAERSSPTSPSARHRPAATYDRVRGVVVLFGGGTWGVCDDLKSDTWEWDGTSWVERNSVHRPPARCASAMAYDIARGEVVLFGGYGYYGALHDDTWEWDGTDWVECNLSSHPGQRWLHAMAYDSAREVTVLFGGGCGNSCYSNETWEWNGTSWAERSPANRPSPRAGAVAAYDAARGVVVLFGGYNDAVGYMQDTWEWDGMEWTERTPSRQPEPRAQLAMAHDSVRGVTVLFGGQIASTPFSNDTWEYGPLVPPPVLSPTDNSDGDGQYLIAWGTVLEANSYTLEEDSQVSFPSPTVRYEGNLTTIQILGQTSGDWYYRVKASNGEDESPWSNVELVGVRPISPTLHPIENSNGDGAYLVDWSDVVGASSFEVQEDDNLTFASPRLCYSGADSEFQASGKQTGVWYYRVLARNTGGSSPWSNVEFVSVAPATPVLMPIDNADANNDYMVNWTDVISATRYELQEDDNDIFDSPIVRYEGTNTQFHVVEQPAGLWYYRIRSFNSAGHSSWSHPKAVVVAEPCWQVYLPVVLRDLP